MKFIKMMGLAVVAALAVMAMVGASAASASGTACKTNSEPCPAGDLYAAGTKMTAQLVPGTHATLTSSVGNVTCKNSTVAGVLNEPAKAHGEITSLTFTNCTLGETECTVSATKPPYTVTGIATPAVLGKGNGDFTVTQKAGGSVPGATVVCGFFINCTFSSTDITLKFTGGSPAKLKAEAVNLNRSGGICPSTSVWHAEYEVTAPKPLFLTV
ncbi:MAG: hypothetical protein ACJ76B_11090 [Solirubrobacterales bacterium]|jgi:hypothetical protein